MRGGFGYFSFRYPFPRIVFALCLFVLSPFLVFWPSTVSVSAPAFILLFIYPDVFRVCMHTKRSDCYPDHWVGQLALGTAGSPLFTGKKRKISFSVTCIPGLYLSETRGFLTSFQVWELSLTAYAYIWASVVNLSGGSEYKNKVENTKCHFPGRKCVVPAYGLLLQWASLVCVLVFLCGWERSSCVGAAAIPELECR